MRPGGSRRKAGPWAALLLGLGVVATGAAPAGAAPEPASANASLAASSSPAGPAAEDAPEEPGPKVLDLNQATADELTGLPGIGRKKAEAIVALRSRRPFSRPTQLLLVKGIGQKTLLKLMPLVRVGPPPAQQARGSAQLDLKDRGVRDGSGKGPAAGDRRRPARPHTLPVGPGQGPPGP